MDLDRLTIQTTVGSPPPATARTTKNRVQNNTNMYRLVMVRHRRALRACSRRARRGMAADIASSVAILSACMAASEKASGGDVGDERREDLERIGHRWQRGQRGVRLRQAGARRECNALTLFAA